MLNIKLLRFIFLLTTAVTFVLIGKVMQSHVVNERNTSFNLDDVELM